MSDVRQLRNAIGVSQLRLARLSSVSLRHIQLAEQNIRELSVHEEAQVQTALRRGAEELRQFLGDAVGVRRKRQPHRQRQVGKT